MGQHAKSLYTWKQAELPEMPEAEPEIVLPDLEGSEKQISWALDIRKKQLTAVDRYLRDGQRLVALCQDTEKKARAQESLRNLLADLESLQQISSAHWWIEMRELLPAGLLAAAARRAERTDRSD